MNTARPLTTDAGRETGRVHVEYGVGAVILLALFASAVLAPVLTSWDPTAIDLASTNQSVSTAHLLGTDNLGRDVLSRVLYAGRTDLLIATAATLASALLGVALGSLAGWSRGWPSAVVLRMIDVVAAFPFLVLVLALLTVIGPGTSGLLIAVPVISWVSYARLSRAELLVLRDRGLIDALRVLGLRGSRILVRHALPHAIGPCIIYCASDFVGNLVLIASVSYLGVGVQPPTPEWGSMIAESQHYLDRGTLPVLAAACAIILAGVGASLLGDGLAYRLRKPAGGRP